MATTGYQPTQLALDIHDLPHYNFDLQQVDGQFTVYYSGSFDNYEYGQTVVVAAGFLIGFLLLYWIALSVWGCCCSANCKRACGCNQCAVATSDEAGATTIKPARAALLFTTLLSVTVVAIAVWGYTVPSGIGKATDKLKTLNGNMKSIVDSLVTSADQFILTTDSAINQTNTLATQVNAVDPALSTSITGVGSQLQSTKTAIEGFRSVAVGLEWNNMDVNDKLDEFKKTYYDVFYALLVTGVLAAFLDSADLSTIGILDGQYFILNRMPPAKPVSNRSGVSFSSGAQLSAGMRQMMSRIATYEESAMIYDSEEVQAQALACIPLDELTNKAEDSVASNSAGTTNLREELIKQLLSWFKGYFRWVNAPDCDHCGGKTTSIGAGHPTEEDRKYGAGRVEVYRCQKCQGTSRFPRYNHPGKIMQTRRGRCGEYAQ
eukprot:757684_1